MVVGSLIKNKKGFMRNDWMYIIAKHTSRIKKMSALMNYPVVAGQLEIAIQSIFTTLYSLRDDRFLEPKEVENIYLLLSLEIFHINEVLDALEQNIWSKTYQVITDTFEELLKLTEQLEKFEVSANLIRFRDFWFSQVGIKLVKRTHA